MRPPCTRPARSPPAHRRSRGNAKIRSRQDGTRTRILAESAALFVAHGYENVSVEQIIAAAGIARSSFYRFFANREEVLASIIRPVFVDGLAQLEPIAARDARGVLHGIFDAYLALWAASPDALRLSTRTGGIYFELFRDLHMPVPGADHRAAAPGRARAAAPAERQRRVHRAPDRPNGRARHGGLPPRRPLCRPVPLHHERLPAAAATCLEELTP